MAKLVFEMMVSLDGYINDAAGDFDWGHIDAQVHGHANREGRRCGLAVYGRRMYETMAIWETYQGGTPFEAEYAELWRQTDKIVVSKTLTEAKTRRTKILPSLDAEAMGDLKAQAGRDTSYPARRLLPPIWMPAWWMRSASITCRSRSVTGRRCSRRATRSGSNASKPRPSPTAPFSTATAS
ncbi:hypothetical protein ABCW43_06290 [Neorhizobium sp. IRAMC:178]|uniref:dihydrofolate reductase family protein n=1 Tax=Neorhizobium tunisiense TaxID=3144793 RepID=UPI0031F6DCA7